jgi:lipoate-protein ligase A
LLLNADISLLNGSLKRSGGIYTDKAVQSNRSEVINLNACMKHKMTPPVFCEAMFDYMIAYFNGSQYTMDQDEKNAIEKVADEKYRTWEWIFGWSPDYEFRNTWKNEKGNVEIYLKVHRGMMLTCDIISDRLSVYCKNLSLLISTGKHEEHTIHYAVRTAMNGILTDREMEDLTYAFF